MMNRFARDAARNNGRTRGAKAQFHLAAVRAFVWCGEVTWVGKAATLAKGRFDETDLRPATRTDKTVLDRRALRFAELADFRIEKREEGVNRVLN